MKVRTQSVLVGVLMASMVSGGIGYAQKPAQQIDVSGFPKEAKLVERVVVPVPSEVFAVLDLSLIHI